MSLRRWAWYHRLVFIDTFRGLRLLLLHICIVAGICLPILILRGINRGHIADLRHSLETNPTGREVIFWTAQHGPILDDDIVKSLEDKISGVELIIPDLRIMTGISSHDGKNEIADLITLHSTRPGDPILAQLKADVVQRGEKTNVLSPAAASELAVGIGEKVSLTLFRAGEEHKVDFEVKGILDQSSDEIETESPDENPQPQVRGSNIGYLDVQAINSIRKYKQGYVVQEWGLPASANLNAPVTFASCLLFCKKTDDMSEADLEILRESYVVDKLDDIKQRTLFGLLNEKSLAEVNVYQLYSTRSLTDPKRRLTVLTNDIAKKTTPDEVIVPWNEPRLMAIENEMYRVVGCTVDDLCWLRKYMIERDAAFDYSADEFAVRFPGGGKLLKQPSVAVLLNNKEKLELDVEVTVAQKAAAEKPAADGDKPADKKPADKKPAADGDKPADKKPADKKPAADGDKPADKKPAVDGDKPADKKPAVDGDKPADKKPAVDGDKPADKKPAVDGDKPADKKPAVDGDKPADKKPAADGDKPADKKPAADGDKPADKKPAADGDKPADKKPAADGDKPADKKPAADGDKPADSKEDASVPQTTEPQLAVVPINLLAHLDAFKHGVIDCDPKQRKFVPVPDRPKYDKARLYAATIDDVPKVVAELNSRKFVTKSQETRIKEIHEQASSLDVLVFTVGLIVFVFGLGTVATVLWDSTNRKRKDIGILRIMGVSGPAVLYMVMMRAALIGIFATLLTYGVAWGACEFLAFKDVPTDGAEWLNQMLSAVLSWKESLNLTANAFVDLREDWIIACVALGCSLVGSIAPGVLASRRDPFDAVVQSKDT